MVNRDHPVSCSGAVSGLPVNQAGPSYSEILRLPWLRSTRGMAIMRSLTLTGNRKTERPVEINGLPGSQILDARQCLQRLQGRAGGMI